MKNYFDFANREADQDHFIQWLIMSYDSENILEKNASTNFLKMLIGEVETDIQIKQVKVRYQVDLKEAGRIDFVCGIHTSNNSYLIAIEDKIEAPIYNDLKKYNIYIIKNQIDLLKSVEFSADKIIPIFILLKTGKHLSNYEKDKIKKSGFRLVDKDAFINCLKDYASHYLIDSFLNKKLFIQSSLETYRGKKGILCEDLSFKLKYNINFENAKYIIHLNDEKGYKLQLNNFSLKKPIIMLYVYGNSSVKNPSNYFKLFKKAKDNKLAIRKEEINSSFPCLVNFLERSIKEALNILADN